MRTLSELAKDGIIAAGVIDENRISLEKVEFTDWDRKPIVLIEETDENITHTQFGASEKRSILAISVAAKDRSEAVNICKTVGDAAFAYLESLERQQVPSGIGAIMRGTTEIENIENTVAYRATKTYAILNFINL